MERSPAAASKRAALLSGVATKRSGESCTDDNGRRKLNGSIGGQQRFTSIGRRYLPKIDDAGIQRRR